MISSTIYEIIISAFAVYGFIIALYEIKNLCLRQSEKRRKKDIGGQGTRQDIGEYKNDANFRDAEDDRDTVTDRSCGEGDETESEQSEDSAEKGVLEKGDEEKESEE